MTAQKPIGTPASRLNSLFSFLVLGAASVGMLWLGFFGTSHTMAWHWPAWICFGVAGLLSVVLAFAPSRSRIGILCLGVTLALAGYVIWRSLSSVPAYRARMDLLLILGVVLVYALFASVFTGSRTRFCFVLALVLLGLANSIVAFYQVASEVDFAFLGLFVDGVKRIKHNEFPGGLFNNHNHFAGFMEIVIILTAALVFFGRLHRLMRVLLVLCGIISMLALGLSASRGGFFALGAGLVTLGFFAIILWIRMFPERKIYILTSGVAGLVVVAGAALAFFFLSIDKRQGQGGTGLERLTNISVREKNWEIALNQFHLSPVIGTGSRTYVDYFSKLWPEDLWVNAGHARFAHNEYLQMLAEYGLIGLGLVILFVLVHAGNGVRVIFWFRGRDGPAREVKTITNLALLAGALSVIAAYTVHSAVDFNLHFPVNAVPVAFCFAICANPGFGPRHERKVPLVFRRLPRLIPALAGAGLLTLGWRWAPAEFDYLRADLAFNHGDSENSVGYLQSAIEKDPSIPAVWKLLALTRYNRQTEELPDFLVVQYLGLSREALEKAHELNPNDYWTMMTLGDTWHRLAVSPALRGEKVAEAYAQAQSWYAKALEWAPSRTNIWMNYGIVLTQRAGFVLVSSGDTAAAAKLLHLSNEAFQIPSGIGGFKGKALNAIAENNRILAKLPKSGQSSP